MIFFQLSNEFHPSLTMHMKQAIKLSLQRIFDLKVLQYVFF